MHRGRRGRNIERIDRGHHCIGDPLEIGTRVPRKRVCEYQMERPDNMGTGRSEKNSGLFFWQPADSGVHVHESSVLVASERHHEAPGRVNRSGLWSGRPVATRRRSHVAASIVRHRLTTSAVQYLADGERLTPATLEIGLGRRAVSIRRASVSSSSGEKCRL